MQLIESDGEVSQFDSLDTFSDGGMNTENFNTMKKVRLAPIDPPPEFQVNIFNSLVNQEYVIHLYFLI